MLGVGGFLFGLYLWLGGLELLFLAVAVGVLMVGGLLLHLFGPKRFEINRRMTPIHAVSGQEVMVTVQVSFRSRIPLAWMIITDRWSGGVHRELLFPGFRTSFVYTYSLPNVTRGHHHLENCCVKWGDLPGWFTGTHDPKEKSEFKVLPAPLYFGRGNRNDGFPTKESAALGRRSKEEVMEIRHYLPGDPWNRIHWKSSARHGTLHSRTPERVDDHMICIVLDNALQSYEIPFGALISRKDRGKETTVFEKAVSAAMGLILTAEHAGTYVQLYSGGWPEGMARYEGLGKIPGRVLDILTEIRPDSTRSLSDLLDDASRGWIPGMGIAVITGGLEQESAKVLARLLASGVKVNLYYAWDRKASESGRTDSSFGTLGDSLKRLGARLYCLEPTLTKSGQGVQSSYDPSGQPNVR